MTLDKALSYMEQLKIGNTSLINVDHCDFSAKILAKCEWENEFGSIKDRVALAMLMACLKKHPELLRKNTPFKIIEYSGGNLAISLSKMCAAVGVNLTVVLPGGVQKPLTDTLVGNGAEVILSDQQQGFLGAILLAKKISRKDKYSVFLYQHRNKENIECHKKYTANEIIKTLDISFNRLKPKAFVASIGTGASLVGIYQGLKEKYPDIQLYATSPFEMPYATKMAPNEKKKFAGSGGLGYGLRQYFVNPYEDDIRGFYNISLDECYDAALDYYNKTGVLLGSSSSANLIAAKKIAEKFSADSAVLTVFPSLATKSEKTDMGIVE